MWPATPSTNPNFANKRNADARRCLRCSRSSPADLNVGMGGVWAIFTPEGTVVAAIDHSPFSTDSILLPVVGPLRRQLRLLRNSGVEINRRRRPPTFEQVTVRRYLRSHPSVLIKKGCRSC